MTYESWPLEFPLAVKTTSDYYWHSRSENRYYKMK